jgi:hypothetical protein
MLINYFLVVSVVDEATGREGTASGEWHVDNASWHPNQDDGVGVAGGGELHQFTASGLVWDGFNPDTVNIFLTYSSSFSLEEWTTFATMMGWDATWPQP